MMQNVASFLNENLKTMFPNSGLRVCVRKILSEDTISIYYINAESAAACTSGIDMNDPAYMHIYIDSDGKTAECSNSNARRNGVKFRKINGVNAYEVAAKIVTWFAKNKDALIALGVNKS